MEGGKEGGREGGCNFTTWKILHCAALYVLHVKQYFTISLFIFLSLSSSRPEDLMNDVELAAGTPVEHQVIFSSQSDIYISKNSNTSQADFNFFMNRAGGSQVYTCTVHVIVLMCVC